CCLLPHLADLELDVDRLRKEGRPKPPSPDHVTIRRFPLLTTGESMTPKIPSVAGKSEAAPYGGRGSRAQLTTPQRLEEVEKLLARVEEHARFIRGVAAMQSSSAEAKDAAVAAFHERLTQLERQLGLIAEGLRLG